MPSSVSDTTPSSLFRLSVTVFQLLHIDIVAGAFVRISALSDVNFFVLGGFHNQRAGADHTTCADRYAVTRGRVYADKAKRSYFHVARDYDMRSDEAVVPDARVMTD